MNEYVTCRIACAAKEDESNQRCRFRARPFVTYQEARSSLRQRSLSRPPASRYKENMLKRMLVMLLVTALIVGALGFVKFKQIQTAIGQAASFAPPPEAVTTITAVQEPWPETLTAMGSVGAVQGVRVSADLPGTVDRIAFGAGLSVREGEVLALLDTRQEQAQLAAAEAQKELARLSFERMQGLLNENVVSRAEFDRATADLRQGDARVGEIRAAIDRKTIRAPFSGILGIRHVNLGQYLPVGDSVFVVTDLQDPSGKPYRGVRQQFVKVGPARGDQISILSGVKAGDEVVTSGVFKLRNGAAVQINNKVRPGNSRAPKPENS